MESSEWRCFMCMEAYMASSEFSPIRLWPTLPTSHVWENRYKEGFIRLALEEKREFRDTTAGYIKVMEERCFQHHYGLDDSHNPIGLSLCNIVPSAEILAKFLDWNQYSQMLHWPDLKREYDGLS